MEDLKEQIISFETAKLVKSKKFSVPTRFCYRNKELVSGGWHLYNSYKDEIGAFSQSLIQRWLREEYNISIEIFTRPEWFLNKKCFRYKFLIIKGTKKYEFEDEFSVALSYEEALEMGLKEGIKLIKN